MAFAYESETFSIVDESRDIVIKPGAGRGDLGETQYHIFHGGCEYVRTTWMRQSDIHYKFAKEKGPDGRRAKTVTLGKNPTYHLQTSKLVCVQGDAVWNDELEQLFREAMYFKLMRSVGAKKIKKIDVSFGNAFNKNVSRYVPSDDAAEGES